ncbi:MAG: hypothetical protein FJX46_14990 [Alphaproteobacteria bacterium]|nr:hypothetical protein [Alphaproteobacteria bacterium]
MPAIAMRAVLLFLAAFLALAGRGGLASELLVLKQADVGAEEEFFRTLIKDMNLDDVYPDYDIDDIGVARYDLDGDGQYELLVGFARAMFCIAELHPCQVYIYRHTNGNWSCIGGTYSRRIPSWATFEIFVEPHAHEGWRVLSDGEYWRCWTRRTALKGYSPSVDPTQQIRATGMAGYFWSVKRGEPCPDD